MNKLILSLTALLIVVVGAAIGYEKYQDHRLHEWARNVELSQNQKEAMWALWTSYKAGTSSKVSPLRKLSREELKQLQELSIPSELARKKTYSYNKFNRLKEMGFDVDERAVIMAMEINHVGRKDLL